jgi:phospholipid-transporting ATPase
MYYAHTDTPALCRTSSLVEELGQIEYVFSDKTGTLTCNEMEFQCCSIGGRAYAEIVDENKKEGEDPWRTFDELRAIVNDDNKNPFDEKSKEREVAEEFLILLAVCHTVIPEEKEEKIVFQASSPDEAALVAGAETLGYGFYVSSMTSFMASSRSRSSPDAQTEICVRQD